MSQAQAQYQLSSSAVSDRGLNEKRPQNEDSYLDLPAMGLFVVADGVGGAQAGEVASQTAIEVLSEAFTHVQGNVDVEDLMEIAIQRANAAIFQMSQEVTRLSSMATTIVALHVSQNVATIGHVGDSRLYRLDAKGNLFRETQDHSVVEEEVRAGRLTPEQAANHPSRNVISRALGADDLVEVDMKTMNFEAGSVFLLCSDGITRHVSDPELREVLTMCKTPQQACSELKSLCYSRGAEDNLTAVIIKTSGPSVSAEDPAGELDENTIQSIRPAMADGAVAAVTEVATDKGTADSQLSSASPHSNEGALYRMEGITGTASDDPVRQYEKMKAERGEIVRIAHRGGFVGRMFKTLVLLIIGAGLGAGGYYYWTLTHPTIIVTSPQIQNPPIPYSAFEEDRRAVDKDPVGYMAKHKDPVNAEDYYLIGRALLHQKKYADAATALQRAKESLNMTGEENRRTLETEIAQALSIAGGREAQAAFEKAKPAATGETNTNTNNSRR
jgi:serine/threonine protein phosphatase PrpC